MDSGQLCACVCVCVCVCTCVCVCACVRVCVCVCVRFIHTHVEGYYQVTNKQVRINLNLIAQLAGEAIIYYGSHLYKSVDVHSIYHGHYNSSPHCHCYLLSSQSISDMCTWK